MRAVCTASVLVLLAGCGAPAIDDTLGGEDIKLPDRGPEPPKTARPMPSVGAPPPAADNVALTVTLTGSGTGTITSTPAGVTCTATSCTGSFARGTSVTLSAGPKDGSVFTGWTGACTGTAGCTAKLDKDTAVSAEHELLQGTWSGAYTNNRPAGGCNFTNAGNMAITMTASGAAITNSGTVTGLEIRQLSNCALVGKVNGTAPDAPATLANGTLTGTWSFAVQGGGGSLAFPFTGKFSGKTMTGTWTCPSCTGSFTFTRQ